MADMNLEKLTKELVDKQADLKQAKISKATGELANPLRIKQLRKEIARIKTTINQILVEEREED